MAGYEKLWRMIAAHSFRFTTGPITDAVRDGDYLANTLVGANLAPLHEHGK